MFEVYHYRTGNLVDTIRTDIAGHAVDLVDDGAAGLPVGDLQGGGAAVLHLDLIGLAVQLIALGRFQLRHLIPALFRFGQGNDAGAVGGVGADDLPVELADFLDTQPKTIYVEYGGCTTITWKNTAVTGQIQITKTSADYNSMNGTSA